MAIIIPFVHRLVLMAEPLPYEAVLGTEEEAEETEEEVQAWETILKEIYGPPVVRVRVVRQLSLPVASTTDTLSGPTEYSQGEV